jgi:hypothetical protein
VSSDVPYNAQIILLSVGFNFQNDSFINKSLFQLSLQDSPISIISFSQVIHVTSPVNNI